MEERKKQKEEGNQIKENKKERKIKQKMQKRVESQ